MGRKSVLHPLTMLFRAPLGTCNLGHIYATGVLCVYVFYVCCVFLYVWYVCARVCSI